MISSITLLTNIAKADEVDEPWEITGYVYVDNTITKPNELVFRLTSRPYRGKLYDDGHFLIRIWDDDVVGEPGNFEVIINDKKWNSQETLTIEENNKLINLNLTIVTNVDSNQPPIAEAGGPYYEIVNNHIEFNGSKSTDPDGTITAYNWDFGDNETGSGIKPTHIYLQTGKYQIKLTVTDNDGLTDISYTYAYITATPNIPPTNLTITGPTNGTIQTKYEYTIQAIDLDNDSLQYTIDWGDETQTNSDFLKNGTSFIINHSYNEPGIFNIIAIGMDENSVYSETVELTVLIDATYCKNLGYLVDYTGDRVYDLFHANKTGIETTVEKNNGNYLIDSDNDGAYDYKYNPATNVLIEYTTQDESGQNTPQTSFTLPLRPEIILAIVFVIVVIVLTSYMVIRRKKRPKKEKSYYLKEKKKQKLKKKIEKIQESKDIKELEKQIDEILSKKK